MDIFLQFAKKKSNIDDFLSIFQAQAKFKPKKVSEAMHQKQFKFQISKIIRDFMNYLINTEEFWGSTEINIAQRVKSGEIDQSDLIMHFSNWLNLEYTVFVLPKQIPKPLQKQKLDKQNYL